MITTYFHTEIDNVVEGLKNELYQKAEIWSQTRSPSELFDVEQALQGILNSFQTKFVGALLKEIHRDHDFVVACQKQAVDQSGVYGDGWRPVSIRTLGGKQTRIRTPYSKPPKHIPQHMLRKEQEGFGMYPVLRRLGIVLRRTPRLLAEASRQITDGPSGIDAEERLTNREILYGQVSMWLCVRDFSSIALWQREKNLSNLKCIQMMTPAPLLGKRVVISLDGGRLRIRVNKQRHDQTDTQHLTTNKCEVKLFVIYTFDQEGTKEREGIMRYDGTIQSVDSLLALLKLRLLELGIQYASRIVILGDGAHWIWNLSEKLQVDLGMTKHQVVEIVDLFHAIGKLSSPSKLGTDGHAQQQKWFKKTRRLLKKGQVDEVISALQSLDQTTDRDNEIRKTIEYFETYKEQMQYDHFRSEKLPLGSGVIESGVRRIINLRMKNTTIFWRPENAEAVLYLRCQAKSHRWVMFVKSALLEWASDMSISLVQARHIRKQIARQFLKSHPPVNIESREEIIKWACHLIDRDDVLILDTETTGLGEHDEVIQLALVNMDSNIVLDVLIKPTVPVCSEALKIHKISDQCLQTAAIFPELYDDIAERIRNKYIVAYNAKFDRRMLRQTCNTYGLKEFEVKGWECAMKKYAYFRGEDNHRVQSLSTACVQQGILIADTHHAVTDCLLTLKLIEAIAMTEE